MADIKLLQDSGLDIVCNKSRQNQYFIGERCMELPELKLLVDAVQASKFIPAKKSTMLIEKLTALASIYQAGELNRRLYVEKQVKGKNERLFYVIDLLTEAVNKAIKIEFRYYAYTASKRRVYKHSGQIYVFSPYDLIWNNDKYYVVGYSDSHGKIIKFRVDRIAVPQLTEIQAVPQPKDYNIAEYAKTVFQMFDEETHEVVLKCDNALMKHIIDRFGEDVNTEICSPEQFRVTISVSASQTFFGWVFSFAGRMKIVAPQEVRSRYMSMLRLADE